MASSSERPDCTAALWSMEANVWATLLLSPSTSVTPSVAGKSAETTATTLPSASDTGATPLIQTPH